MLFSVSIGSAGTGEPRYSLWFPITLTSTATIATGSEPLPGSELVLQIHSLEGVTVFQLHGFTTADEARTAIDPFRGALMLWGVEKRLGLSLPKEEQEIKFFPQPVQGIGNKNFGVICEKVGWDTVDGHYDIDQVAVLPEHKRLVRWAMGTPRVTIGTDARNVARDLAEVMRLPSIMSLPKTEPLALAVETYLATQFPISRRARFLEMVTVLEIIATAPPLPTEAARVLTEVLQLVKSQRDAHPKPSSEHKEIGRLLDRLGNLRKESIKESMRHLTRWASARLGLNTDEAVTTIGELYDRRSYLVHDGLWTDRALGDDLAWLSDFVPKVLALLMRDQAV